jgi:lipid II:glycine glycyltransferase (peptidoglycan interpeptide bridge formation enzyme)
VEFRGAKDFLNGEIPSEYYIGHTLDLTKGVDKIFSSFRESTKRNIRKAGMEGVVVGIFTSFEAIREFYRLNCLTRRNHGLPPQPFYFFKKIYEHIISKNCGFILLASYNKKIIAGAVYFHLGDKALFKYGASDKNYQHLRANNLVMWEAIKYYSQNGYKSFCFGRTEPENRGLLQFKVGWGTEEYIINYYKYDLKKEVFVRNPSRVVGFHNKIVTHMPIPLLKISGLLYKHIG